jgi:hypothetical protein
MTMRSPVQPPAMPAERRRLQQWPLRRRRRAARRLRAHGCQSLPRQGRRRLRTRGLALRPQQPGLATAGMCRVVDTVLVDQETIYAPRHGNDRLLLGLKGSLNEYELDLLRQRSLSARYVKARRGELVVGAPVGFVKRDRIPANKASSLQSHSKMGVLLALILP